MTNETHSKQSLKKRGIPGTQCTWQCFGGYPGQPILSTTCAFGNLQTILLKLKFTLFLSRKVDNHPLVDINNHRDCPGYLCAYLESGLEPGGNLWHLFLQIPAAAMAAAVFSNGIE